MTPKTLEAVVEGGKLRPLQQLDLPEQQHVLVTIVTLIDGARRNARSCYDFAQELGIIGVADDTPVDLSLNPEYLDRLGSR